MKPSTKAFWIGAAVAGGAGLVIYLANKKTVSPIPPMIVTGWASGIATFKLGTQTGSLNPANGGSGTISAGPYSINVNDYDGTGYDITVVGTGINQQNQIYVTGNGSFSFTGKKFFGFLGSKKIVMRAFPKSSSMQ